MSPDLTHSFLIKPKVRSADVKDKIEASFRRHAELDARRVGVEASDGNVSLRRSVRSWGERTPPRPLGPPRVSQVVNERVVTP